MTTKTTKPTMEKRAKRPSQMTQALGGYSENKHPLCYNKCYYGEAEPKERM